MPPAAIYARVSSQQQREQQTISSQTQAVKEHASRLGYEIPAAWVFEDDGVSGATLVRPGLERLRDLVAQVEVPVILCYSPDRLARKYAYQALLIEEFARAGTEVRFVKGPQADTPEDELLLQFQGMIAEYEKAQIAERSRRGKVHRARAGATSVLSTAPYGYRYIRKTEVGGGRYEVLEHQAVVLREVFRRYTEEQMSIGALARWLTEQGIPTAQGKARWDRSTVWGMLRNPAYCGRAAFRKTMSTGDRPRVTRPWRLRGVRAVSRPSTRPRSRDEWIEIAVPAIVSEEMFALAARRLEDNKRFAARRTKEPSLLQGLVACRSCGYSYYRTSTRTSKRKIYYYRCLGSDDYRWEGGRVCTNRPVRQDTLDALVWDQIMALISDPTLVRRELDRRLDQLRTSSTVTAQKARLESELKKLERAKNRLVLAYQEELLSLSDLRSRMPELRQREANLRAQLEALEAQLLDRETYLKLAETLETFLDRLRTAADSSSIEQRQRVLRLLVREVLVDDDRVVVRHSIPTGQPGGGPGYLLGGRGDHPSLWGPRLRVPYTPLLHHSRLQPLADHASDHAVAHPPGQKRPQVTVVQLVEEAPDVDLQHPSAPHPRDLTPEDLQRLVRATARPEAPRAVQKVLLVDGLQDHRHRALQHLVLERGHPDRPGRRPATLRNLHRKRSANYTPGLSRGEPLGERDQLAAASF